jgi:excisionase family DNA binding protein
LTQIRNSESDLNDPNLRLLDTREIAHVLGKSPRAVQYMIKARVIPHVRIGRNVRFRLPAVMKALEKLTIREVSIQ